jgi:hypothetical protein
MDISMDLGMGLSMDLGCFIKVTSMTGMKASSSGKIEERICNPHR